MVPTTPMCVEAFADYPSLDEFAIEDMRQNVAFCITRAVEKSDRAGRVTEAVQGPLRYASIENFCHILYNWIPECYGLCMKRHDIIWDFSSKITFSVFIDLWNSRNRNSTSYHVTDAVMGAVFSWISTTSPYRIILSKLINTYFASKL